MTRLHTLIDRLLRHARTGASLALCAALLAQPAWGAAPGPDGNRGHLNRLLHNPAVISHLGLSDSQAKAAQAASNAVVEKHRAGFEAAAAYDTREARVAHVARLFVTITEQTFAQLKDVLSPAQQQRLQGRPAVADYLALTAAQQRALATIATDAGQQSQANVQSPERSPAEKSRQGQLIRETALQAVRQQLNAEQWVKWELLTGARFEF